MSRTTLATSGSPLPDRARRTPTAKPAATTTTATPTATTAGATTAGRAGGLPRTEGQAPLSVAIEGPGPPTAVPKATAPSGISSVMYRPAKMSGPIQWTTAWSASVPAAVIVRSRGALLNAQIATAAISA